MIVIYSFLFGFSLHCLKNKFCPQSWEPYKQTLSQFEQTQHFWEQCDTAVQWCALLCAVASKIETS